MAREKKFQMVKKFKAVWAIGLILLVIGSSNVSANDAVYNFGKLIGELAVSESLKNMYAKGAVPDYDNLIVMSNAGYAEMGLCSYLQVNPAMTQLADLFSISTIEKINAGHLYANAAEYSAKFGNSIFGGNEFRIVTIMNAIASGAPAYAARAFEFHDHYCPGVTSGILMANYLKKQFPLAFRCLSDPAR